MASRPRHGGAPLFIDMQGFGGRANQLGKFQVEEFDREIKRLIVTVKCSPFAVAYWQSAQPVCDMTRGLMAGMGHSLSGGVLTEAETHCLAKDDDLCRFLIKAKSA